MRAAADLPSRVLQKTSKKQELYSMTNHIFLPSQCPCDRSMWPQFCVSWTAAVVQRYQDSVNRAT